MKKKTYTAGPWGIKDNLGEKTFSIYRQSELNKFTETKDLLCLSVKIANVYTGGLYYGESAEANAHLIAAAPELLEALKAIIGAIQVKAEYKDFAIIIEMAKRKIAKAEGSS